MKIEVVYQVCGEKEENIDENTHTHIGRNQEQTDSAFVGGIVPLFEGEVKGLSIPDIRG